MIFTKIEDAKAVSTEDSKFYISACSNEVKQKGLSILETIVNWFSTNRIKITAD